MIYSDEYLHDLARRAASVLYAPDKKQLRFNDIVRVARLFYNDAAIGVIELTLACDKETWDGNPNPLYTERKDPMWLSLENQHGWMICKKPAKQLEFA